MQSLSFFTFLTHPLTTSTPFSVAPPPPPSPLLLSPGFITCYVNPEFSFTLKACARILGKFEALQVHSHVLRSGFFADALLGTTLLNVYAKAGDLASARKVFDEMSVRDIVSSNALISGLANGNFANEAIELFYRMREEGLFRPNEIRVLGALAACSALGAFQEGEKVCEYIRDERLDMNVIVCNAVIDMFPKCGSIDNI